ncbi:MAG: response regulator [Kofleriaceae bacterium]
MTTILLVEDNPITCKLVRYTLEKDGYQVIDAPDGATGLALYLERRPSLILLDMLLPDIDGFELFHKLRALPNGSDVPILAFSGILSVHDEARLSEVGFDDVVTKPIEPSRLLQIVKGYLPPVDPAPTPRGDGTVRTLVVADDDAVQRKMVALRLQRAGFKVTTAADGQEALERARELRPYAIVSDVLMPRLDGFGLCMAVRSDPSISQIPIVLISNSYLDSEDKSLARRAGADDMLVRTPELRDVIELLHNKVGTTRVRRSQTATLDPELERERIRRMMNQLERQVAMHAGMSQRCSLLSAELSVLSGISEAVATEHDIEGALHQILASCFDAGGISLGTMYLLDDDKLRGVRFGMMESWSDADVTAFFGHRDLLDAAIASQSLVTVPSEAHPEGEFRTLLDRTGARSLTIAPLGHKGQPLGALVTMSRSLEFQPSDRIAFVAAVAGQISLALALARSFQAKDASERAARANATVLRSILDSMAEGVVVSDEHGAVTHWNQAATSILHVAAEDLRAQVIDRPEFPLARALRGESVDRAEVSLDKTETWLSINARPLGDDQSAHGAVAVFRDVTIERAAQTRMLVSERMASLGTLAAGVGHEINNPLMSVLGNLEMAITDLRRIRHDHAEVDFLELGELLRDGKEAAERVRDIVRDLKLFSRSDEETGGEVDVEHVMESSVRMVWNEIRHRATLVRDYHVTPKVYANESRLGQVFLNLVVNAAQAIPEGRASQNEIRIGIGVAPDGRVRVSVTDTGCGMTPELVAKIFTPFFTTKPIGVGTGLGLAICHQLVVAAGGEITVESTAGVGTTFAVLLPPSHSVERVESVVRPAVRDPRRRKILVIDDELLVATTFRRALGRDHDVTMLTDPRHALRLIEGGERFDLVICDLMMPDMTGMDLHAELVARVPEMARRMVFITGGAFTEQAREFLDTHKNPSLEKPIDLEGLRTFVDARLEAIDADV